MFGVHFCLEPCPDGLMGKPLLDVGSFRKLFPLLFWCRVVLKNHTYSYINTEMFTYHLLLFCWRATLCISTLLEKSCGFAFGWISWTNCFISKTKHTCTGTLFFIFIFFHDRYIGILCLGSWWSTLTVLTLCLLCSLT